MRWIFKIASVLRRVRRSNEPVEIGDTLDGTFDHYFTEEEIKAELEAAGFEMIHYAADPFGHAVGRAV